MPTTPVQNTAPVMTNIVPLSQDELNRRGEALIQMLANVKLLQEQLDAKKQELMPHLQKGPIVLPDGTISLMKPAQRLNLNRKMLKQVLMQHLKISEPTAETILNTGSLRKIINAYVKITQKHLNKAKSSVPTKMSDIHNLVNGIKAKIKALKKFADDETVSDEIDKWNQKRIQSKINRAKSELVSNKINDIEFAQYQKNKKIADTIAPYTKIYTSPDIPWWQYPIGVAMARTLASAGDIYQDEKQRNTLKAKLDKEGKRMPTEDEVKNARKYFENPPPDAKIKGMNNVLQAQNEIEKLSQLSPSDIQEQYKQAQAGLSVRQKELHPYDQNVLNLLKTIDRSSLSKEEQALLDNLSKTYTAQKAEYLNAAPDETAAIQSKIDDTYAQLAGLYKKGERSYQTAKQEKPVKAFEEGPYAPVKDANGNEDVTATALKRLGVMSNWKGGGEAKVSPLLRDTYNSDDEIDKQLAVLVKQGALQSSQVSRIKQKLLDAENRSKSQLPMSMDIVDSFIDGEIKGNKAINDYIENRQNQVGLDAEVALDKNADKRDIVVGALKNLPPEKWNAYIAKFDGFIDSKNISDQDKNALFQGLQKQVQIEDKVKELQRDEQNAHSPALKAVLKQQIEAAQDSITKVYKDVPAIKNYQEAQDAYNQKMAELKTADGPTAARIKEKELPIIEAQLHTAYTNLAPLSSVISERTMPEGFAPRKQEETSAQEAQAMRANLTKEQAAQAAPAKAEEEAKKNAEIVNALAKGVENLDVPKSLRENILNKVLDIKDPALANATVNNMLQEYHKNPNAINAQAVDDAISNPDLIAKAQTPITNAESKAMERGVNQKEVWKHDLGNRVLSAPGIPFEQKADLVKQIQDAADFSTAYNAVTPVLEKNKGKTIPSGIPTPEQATQIAQAAANKVNAERDIIKEQKAKQQQEPQMNRPISRNVISPELQKIAESTGNPPEEIQKIAQQQVAQTQPEEDEQSQTNTLAAMKAPKDRLTQLINNAKFLGYTPEQIEALKMIPLPVPNAPVIQQAPAVNQFDIPDDIQKIVDAIGGQYTPQQVQDMKNNYQQPVQTPLMMPIEAPSQTPAENVMTYNDSGKGSRDYDPYSCIKVDRPSGISHVVMS